MSKEELLKHCRYYKGEKECPFDGGSDAYFWNYEERWVAWVLDKDKIITMYLDEYVAIGLKDFEKNDNTPTSLKALLYNRYQHWINGSPAGFKTFYKEQYLR